MNTAKDHYDRQLASVYSWMAGTPEAAINRNHDFLRQLKIDMPRGVAIDLGAGSGFQSIPLAKLGFSVVAIDFCESLLAELSNFAGNLPIRTIHDDILNFDRYVEEPTQLIVCMGDTLTHLDSLNSVFLSNPTEHSVLSLFAVMNLPFSPVFWSTMKML
jgi:2-polyprenyl-3-methyl-5-hydroxy-6-metoxy-1,4-benzoquinol methylase